MNRRTKITLTIIIVCGLLALVEFTISRNFNQTNEPTPSTQWPAEVDWLTTIEIIRSGQVSQVIQAHNLDVILTLKDGSQIKTSEPAIDEIFKEIELCGETCSEILLITDK